MYTVHGMRASGNCYKVQLLLDQLGIDYRWVETDVAGGQTRTPAFAALNANGKVPVLQLDDGRCLAESNAILCYLAEGTPYLSADRWQRAGALQWMFFEQYSHEPAIAVARFIARWLPLDHPRHADLPALRERGHAALRVMERHLSEHAWFSGVSYGVADIALFAYTHCAPDGGIELDAYAQLRAWLDRVRAQPGFTAMQA
ncbi:glutathione S-transferase family protein [Oleiagrimonas soli]|uniref:Glutathione S-transferase n=1 Tax=Oleiagrimonas soli TaxID=1543381 RepID=A0A099CYA0_9GAMM|nr:glutathione S-transferase family protein [Oleiagrimonas soli]KGI77995.1 glutathione S-transferase [Oleiagrimonas soli]MBB6183625.1 glutathione S-transferase [Oleiagrimonas soli]